MACLDNVVDRRASPLPLGEGGAKRRARGSGACRFGVPRSAPFLRLPNPSSGPLRGPPSPHGRRARAIVVHILPCLLALSTPATAGDIIRLALQTTGTLAWEIDVMRAHNLDVGFDLKLIEQAGPEAGKIALKGGAADIIVSDWLFVSRERSLGGTLRFSPYSTSVGAVMVPAASPARTLADLRGKKLAVAGGAIDKGWLLVQAAAKKDGIDLKKEATLAFGAPPLLMEKTLQGEMDANLNFWNLCARMEAKGFRRLVSVEEAEVKLGVAAPNALLGYAFDEAFVASSGPALDKFLAAARAAKDILAASDAEWERIRPLMKMEDEATFLATRARYRDGIPKRPVAEEEADAATLYKVLHDLSGPDLTGPAAELDPGTYYKPKPAGN